MAFSFLPEKKKIFAWFLFIFSYNGVEGGGVEFYTDYGENFNWQKGKSNIFGFCFFPHSKTKNQYLAKKFL